MYEEMASQNRILQDDTMSRLFRRGLNPSG